MLAALERGLEGNKWFSLIDKAGSAEKRPLGIPTVADRVVQTAVRMVIEPILESCFAAQSYGFRPGRGCKDALRRVEELLRAGHTHVVDVDIKGYFDTIPQDRLMGMVRERITDGRLLGLIEGLLKQGVMEAGEVRENHEGTPQGAALSPLLANIYLDGLDWLMVGKGFCMVRYADDIVVLCRNRAEAAEAMTELRQWMVQAGLSLQEQKTRTVDMNESESHFDFLGYRFKRSRRGRLLRLVRPKSVGRLRASLRTKTRRNNGQSMEATILSVNQTLQGWYAYFKHAQSHDLARVDHWVRGRLRSILRKRQGGLGRGRGRDHQRWRNHYFTALGLFCLQEARAAETASLRHGANC